MKANADLEKEIKDLRNQQTKRNLLVGGLMIVGAAGGFLLTRKMKTTTLIKTVSTIGGSLLLGLPVLLITNKKYKERKQIISDKQETSIKISGAKVIVSDKDSKIQTILSNLKKLSPEKSTPDEDKTNIAYLSSLNDQELNFWVKLSNAMLDKSLDAMSEEDRIKALKVKYDIDYKEAQMAMDKMLSTMVGLIKQY